MLELKQTCLTVSYKTKLDKIFKDSSGKQYLYLSCSQQFNSNHKRFKNAFEGIKLFGEQDKLDEMINRLNEKNAVKVEVYDCELYLMQYQDKNVKPFASCHEWNFDNNKFNRKAPSPKVVKTKPRKGAEPEAIEQVPMKNEPIEIEEQKLIFDSDIVLPY